MLSPSSVRTQLLGAEERRQVLERGAERGARPAVRWMAQDGDVVERAALGLDPLGGAVGAPVVDEDHAAGEVGADLARERAEVTDEARDVRRLVEHRDDDVEPGAHGFSRTKRTCRSRPQASATSGAKPSTV